MRMIALIACVGYWAFLTMLLLAPHPANILGRVPVLPWGDLGVHFLAFTALSLLVHATRWPKRPGWWVPFLMLYGLVIESMQFCVPPRTVQLTDYIENLLGVLAGAGLYWAAWRLLPWSRQPHLANELVRLD